MPVAPVPGMEPPAIKVFGVIHLVFAGLGFLTGAWSLVSFFLVGLFVNPKTPGYEARMKMQTDLRWISLMTGIFVLGLATLLLISGLKLVRSQPGGIRWSNRYAWASICTKVISMVVTLIWVVPVTKKVMEETMGSAGLPGGAERGMVSAMSSMVAMSSVITPLISCIYPVLALYFLNRRDAKEWSAARLSGAA
jgi:cytochrome bd-type quinol oxidase subunit 2